MQPAVHHHPPQHPPSWCEPFQGATGACMAIGVGIGTLAVYYARFFAAREDGREVRTLKVFTMDVGKITLGGCVAWAVLIAASLVATVPLNPADTVVVGAPAGAASATAQFQQETAKHELSPIAWYPSALIVESTFGTFLGIVFAKAAARMFRRMSKQRCGRAGDDTDEPAAVAAMPSPMRAFSAALRLFVVANAYSGRYGQHHRPPGGRKYWGSTVSLSGSRLVSPERDGSGDGGGGAASQAGASVDASSNDVSSPTMILHGGGGTIASANVSGYHHIHFAVTDTAGGEHRQLRMPPRLVSVDGSRHTMDGVSMDDVMAAGDAGQQDVRWSWFGAQLATWCVCVAASRVAAAALLLLFIRLCPPQWSPVVALAQWVDALSMSCPLKQLLCVGAFRLAVDVLVLGVTDSATKLSTKSAPEATVA